jgi:hypothetical protein
MWTRYYDGSVWDCSAPHFTALLHQLHHGVLGVRGAKFVFGTQTNSNSRNTRFLCKKFNIPPIDGPTRVNLFSFPLLPSSASPISLCFLRRRARHRQRLPPRRTLSAPPTVPTATQDSTDASLRHCRRAEHRRRPWQISTREKIYATCA